MAGSHVEGLLEPDELALPRACERIQEHEHALASVDQRTASPPICERIRRIWAQTSEGLGSQTKQVKNLGRPEPSHDMGFALPASDAQPLREGLTKIGPLRVEAAGGVLEVWKPRSILDVKQCPIVNVPGDEIRPARELVVLIRLIDASPEAVRTHPPQLELTHCAVNRIDHAVAVLAIGGLRIYQPDIETEAQRVRDAAHCLDRARLAAFQIVKEPSRKPGTRSQAAYRQMMNGPGLSNFSSDVQPETREGRADAWWRRSRKSSWRHWTSSQHATSYH
jgi:hypothetical protein